MASNYWFLQLPMFSNLNLRNNPSPIKFKSVFAQLLLLPCLYLAFYTNFCPFQVLYSKPGTGSERKRKRPEEKIEASSLWRFGQGEAWRIGGEVWLRLPFNALWEIKHWNFFLLALDYFYFFNYKPFLFCIGV